MERGHLLKLRTELTTPVSYQLILVENGTEKAFPLNQFIGNEITLKHTGKIYDIHDGELIKKSYGQGFSYKNFISLAQCDTCIVKPELCHFDKGTCREPEWAKKHCFIPHIIYLSRTSGIKVGITRNTQVPTRWIDQGASEALPILEVSDRKTSGLLEVEIAKIIPDKTNWRKMLKGETSEGPGLEEYKEMIFDQIAELLDIYDATEIEEDIVSIEYPVEKVPEKINSFNFDKDPEVKGTLQGIKGQYFIFDHGVINIRKFQGYEIEFST